MIIDKPLRVGKVDRFQFGGSGLLQWLDGELLQSFTVSPNTDLATLVGVPAEDEPGVIGFFLEGVARGRCKVHINYSTATRSDCATITVSVENC